MSIVPTPSPVARLRRALVAVGMVGAPLLLDLGNLLLPATDGSAAQQIAIVHAHRGAYLTGTVASGVGFMLLGALGAGIAMLLPRRGGLLATIGAVLTLAGAVVMGGAVLVVGFVLAAVPPSGSAVAGALQQDATLGSLFAFGLTASIGGLLCVIALLIGRPVPIWVPILLLVGLVLANLGGGPLSVLLSLPTLVAAALLARAVVAAPAARPEPARVTVGA